jgi:hypothetical protein
MALSAGTFFHFTSYKNLKLILDCQYFQVNYSQERITLRQTTIHPFIPMVCFCDIPLTQTGEHIKKYDGFAIGLSKEWGIGHGLNPVFYVSPIGFTVTLENLSASLKSGDFAKGAFEHIFSFMKPYEEFVEQKKLLYYDEREWRFVPYVTQFQDKIVSQIYWNRGLSEEELKYITGHRFFILDFNISDIKYLITKSDKEKSDLISYLKSTRYSESLMNQSYRILSIDEVYKDF